MWEVYMIITPYYGLRDAAVELLIGGDGVLFTCHLLTGLVWNHHFTAGYLGALTLSFHSYHQPHYHHIWTTEQLIYITSNIIKELTL